MPYYWTEERFGSAVSTYEGSADVHWTGTSNIYANDGAYARRGGPCTSVVLYGSSFVSYIWVSGFGFSVPSNATVTGIRVKFKGGTRFWNAGCDANSYATTIRVGRKTSSTPTWDAVYYVSDNSAPNTISEWQAESVTGTSSAIQYSQVVTFPVETGASQTGSATYAHVNSSDWGVLLSKSQNEVGYELFDFVSLQIQYYIEAVEIVAQAEITLSDTFRLSAQGYTDIITDPPTPVGTTYIVAEADIELEKGSDYAGAWTLVVTPSTIGGIDEMLERDQFRFTETSPFRFVKPTSIDDTVGGVYDKRTRLWFPKRRSRNGSGDFFDEE